MQDLKIRSLNIPDLIKCIYNAKKFNPYIDKDGKLMWLEQCLINFPLLYLASIYLYNYAKQYNCDTFLFATRDCCHWYKIFQKMYPHTIVHYFHCSRNMFEKATGNNAFRKYVQSIVHDIKKTIFVDIHGTGRRVFGYFEQEFSEVPQCFLLSATYESYSQFPQISKKYYEKGKLINLIFNARGSPIEMLNYDTIGTLQNYLPEIGPVRDELEYDKSLIEPYHECMQYLIDQINPVEGTFKRKEVYPAIKAIFKDILVNKPIISKYIKHIANHAKNYRVEDILNNVSFEEIISNNTTYGVIWSGIYDEKPCVVKMVILNENKYLDFNEKAPFHHKEFQNKKALSLEKFNNEVNNLNFLNKFKLAPKVYGYTVQSLNDVTYGFIVMERLHCSLKDILLKRDLGVEEEKIIKSTIDKMHKLVIHGDLKPSNIGLRLNDKNEVEQCLVFDCQKAKYSKDLSHKDLNSLIERDWKNYLRHVEKNRGER